MHCPVPPSARKVNQLAINPVEDLEHCEKALNCVETLCGGLDLKQTHKRQAVVALRRCVVCLQAVACSHVIRASTIVAHGGGTGLKFIPILEPVTSLVDVFLSPGFLAISKQNFRMIFGGCVNHTLR